MALQVETGTTARVLHQCLDAAGSGRVTGQAGSISVTVLDPAGSEVVGLTTVNEIGATGLYTVQFVPTTVGNWLVSVTNPAGTDEQTTDYVVTQLATVVLQGA